MSKREQGFWLDVIEYARTRKRWLIATVVLALSMIGLLILLAEFGPALSPFVYTLF